MGKANSNKGKQNPSKSAGQWRNLGRRPPKTGSANFIRVHSEPRGKESL